MLCRHLSRWWNESSTVKDRLSENKDFTMARETARGGTRRSSWRGWWWSLMARPFESRQLPARFVISSSLVKSPSFIRPLSIYGRVLSISPVYSRYPSYTRRLRMVRHSANGCSRIPPTLYVVLDVLSLFLSSFYFQMYERHDLRIIRE